MCLSKAFEGTVALSSTLTNLTQNAKPAGFGTFHQIRVHFWPALLVHHSSARRLLPRLADTVRFAVFKSW